MAFEHACFISYRHHEDSELASRFISDFRAALRNELAMMIDEGIFIDEERIRGGTFFTPALARALCESMCMVMVYTPTYFSLQHLYCAREYRAMEILERQRLDRMTRAADKESGLIIPVVLRGVGSLPPAIRAQRHCYSFERFSLTSRQIAKNRQFEEMIREIAVAIHDRKAMLDRLGDDPCDCERFSLPTDDELRPWLSTVIAARSPFPFRHPS